MKILDKYLLFIIPAFFILSIFLMDAGYWFHMAFGLACVLYLIEKRNSINNFFSTSRVKLLDKCMLCSIYILGILMFVIHSFFQDINKNFYLSDIILSATIISTIMLKRNFIKNLFKKKGSVQIRNEKDIDRPKAKVKAFDTTIRSIIIGCILLIILANGRINETSFEYLSTIILIIMLILGTIYEYKKKSINK